MLPQPTKQSLAPGIYFGLDEKIYHKDSALSRSDLLNMLDTPNTYWRHSWMNPNRPKFRTTSKEMEYGTAFHYQLFQPELFEKLYRVAGVDAWDDTKRLITNDNYYALVESVKVLRNAPDANLFLSGGMPEVTIIFDCPRTGLRFRTRHDYLTPFLTTDFKTCFSVDDHHIQNEIRKRGYDMQMALYRYARQCFRQQFLDGQAHIYGDCDPAWFQKFIDNETDGWIFIFQRTTPPYPFEALMTEEDTEQSGAKKIDKAIKRYLQYQKSHGMREWPVSEGKVRAFSLFYGGRDD